MTGGLVAGLLLGGCLLGSCLLGLSLSGCGVRTAARPLDGDMLTVTSRGRPFTSQADVRRDAMRSAAKETLKRGYAYFEVLNTEDRTMQGRDISPGQASPASGEPVPGVSMNTITSTGNYDSSSYQTPSMPLSVSRPGYDMVIRMYHAGAIDPKKAGVWNAEAVLKGETGK